MTRASTIAGQLVGVLVRDNPHPSQSSSQLPCSGCERPVWVPIAAWIAQPAGTPAICEQCLQGEKTNHHPQEG